MSLEKRERPQAALRTGFTLVEMVVVLGCSFILLGLVFVAVQSARESARSTQCANNLRNLALGVESFVSSHGYFPDFVTRESLGEASQLGQSRYGRPGPMMLTLREALSNQRIYGDLFASRGEFVCGMQDPPVETEPHPMLLRCPSAGEGNAISYRFCTGNRPIQGVLSSLFADHILQLAGEKTMPFGINIRCFPRDIKDGMSHTSAISERTPGNGQKARNPGVLYGIRFPITTDLNKLARDWDLQCQGPSEIEPVMVYAGYGELPHAESYWQIYYCHYATPNNPNRDCYSTLGQYNANFSARSQHKGGVWVTYLDTSVRFQSNSVDLQVWRSQADIAGGEVDSEVH
jgi:hypothetical protein